MLKHTKIVATVSDQRCDVAFVEALYKAGMNVVRLNTAHMMEEGLTRVVNNVRTVSDRIGILMDTKGPEVRTTTMDNRLIFLYCSMTELWGHVRRAGAGNGKPGTSEVPVWQENPPCNGKT